MSKIKQLYYKNGRRYFEFNKIRETPTQLFYQDADGEFVPLDDNTQSWYSGSPKDGIWYVKHDEYSKSHSWIGDYGMSEFRIKLEKYRDMMLKAIGQALENCDNKYISRNDIATEILNELSKYEEELSKN